MHSTLLCMCRRSHSIQIRHYLFFATSGIVQYQRMPRGQNRRMSITHVLDSKVFNIYCIKYTVKYQVESLSLQGEKGSLKLAVALQLFAESFPRLIELHDSADDHQRHRAWACPANNISGID